MNVFVLKVSTIQGVSKVSKFKCHCMVKKNKKSLFYYDYLPTHWLPWQPHLKAWLLQAADPTGSQIPENKLQTIWVTTL